MIAFYSVAFGICIFLSVVFSLCETALTSLNIVKLRTFVKNKNKSHKREKLIIGLVKEYSQTIAIIVALDNLMAILMSTVSAALTFHLEMNATDTTLTIIASTAIIILVGEIAPKAIARKYSVFYSYHLAYIIISIKLILWPIFYPLSKLRTDKGKAIYSEEELVYLMQLIEKEGIFDYREKELVLSAMHFDEKHAKEIMIPFKQVHKVGINDDAKKIFTEFKKSRHGRILVMSKDDTVQGALLFKDFIYKWEESKFAKKIELDELLHEPASALTTYHLQDVLDLLHKQSNQICLIFDSFKDDIPVGMITMKDISEEMFGIINEEDSADSKIKKYSHSRYQVKPSASANTFFSTVGKHITNVPYVLENKDINMKEWVNLYKNEHAILDDEFTYDHIIFKEETYEGDEYFDVRVIEHTSDIPHQS